MNATEVANRIVSQLRLLDSAASAEVGTPERKLIDACAEVIASAYVDFTVINKQHDVDAMTGARLESYLTNFGFLRQQGAYATGEVTVSRNTAATTDLRLPAGTLLRAISRNDDGRVRNEVVYATLQTVTLTAGTLEVTIPIRCTVPGELGNTDAETVTEFAGLQAPTQVSSVTNVEPITGGTNPEDDTAYKLRFKNTLFRNMAGTYDQYLALAVAASGVTKANVVGPLSRFREFVQVPDENDTSQTTRDFDGTILDPHYTAGGYDSTGANWVNKRTTAVSSIPYSKYTYADQCYLTKDTFNPSDPSSFFRPFVDYVFNTVPVVHDLSHDADWVANTVYPLGSIVRDPGGVKIMQAVVAGTSGGSEPTWPAIDSTVVDGTVTWQTVVTNITTSGGYQVYDFAHEHQPNITILGRGTTESPIWKPNLEPGDLVLLEHAYMSTSSRNDYSLGIMNAVDVFVNGNRETTGNSEHVVPDASYVIQNTDPGTWTYNLYSQTPASDNVINWRRKLDGRVARVGNWLQPLYWQPCLEVPSRIVVADSNGAVNTFLRGNYYDDDTGYYYALRTGEGTDADPYVYSAKAHYVFVEEVNGLHGTIRGRSGIEWFVAGGPNTGSALNGKLATDTYAAYNGTKISDTDNAANFIGLTFTATSYTYDRNIADLQASMERAKQVGTDVLVHRAKRLYFKPYVTVMYDPGSNQNVVDSAIAVALASYFERQYFGAAIQLSDILQAIHNVPGVDNVRWTAPNTYTATTWTAGTSYAVGTIVKPTTPNTNGYYFRCTTAGTSNATTEPTWSTTGTTDEAASAVNWEPIFVTRVELVNNDGTVLESAVSGRKIYTDDFFLKDNELPALPSKANLTVADKVDIERRAANTWQEID